MYRGIEATDHARVGGNDYNDRCDQRQIVEGGVFNFISIAHECAAAAGNDAQDRSVRCRSPRGRSRRLWGFAVAAWSGLVLSIAALPLLDDASQAIIFTADSVVGGSLIGFICWRVQAWASTVLTRVARAHDDRRSQRRTL